MEYDSSLSWKDAVARPFKGATHAVFHLRRADGATAVRKTFRSSRAFRREGHALAFLESAHFTCCPRVLASRAQPEGGEILMTHVAGSVPSGDLLKEKDIWQQAGHTLACLHAIPLPVEDHLDLRCALEQRLQDAQERAVSWCGPKERRMFSWLKDRMVSLKPRGRVFCHGDWAPRNWLWQNSRLFFVDLERSGPNAPEQDLVALHLECWQKNPRAKEAFLAGFNNSGSSFNQDWLDVLVLLYLVGSVNWGLKVREMVWAEESRAALEREFNRVSAFHL